MSQLWFTSDLHFLHEKVAGLRGFYQIDSKGDLITKTVIGPDGEEYTIPLPDVDTHDKAIIANINSVVDKDDTLWILGDLSLKTPDKFAHLFRRLNGHKHVVWGNHDRGFGGDRQAYKWDSYYRMIGVESGHDFARKKVGQEGFLLSHFPYEGDHTEDDRCKQYRLPDFGVKLLHGHTHSTQKLSRSSKKTLQVHVGLDAWDLFPVNSETIAEIARV